MSLKAIISVVAVILSVAGYIPYIRDTVKGKTKPHVYTWFAWGCSTAVVYGLQTAGGAGVGSWVTLTVIFLCFLIFFFGLKNGRKDITKSDTVYFVSSFLALFLWLVVKQPVLSTVLILMTDLLSFFPTVRKSWKDPYSETLFTYELNAFRHGLSVFALERYSITTWLYPGVWTFINLFFSAMLILRRKTVGKIG